MAQGELRSNGGDVPQRAKGQTGETSSLGLVWPPEKMAYNRLKGFYFTAIQSETEFEGFKKEWDAATSALFFDPDCEYSRITMRAVVNNEYLLSHKYELGGMIEAAIPLEGGVNNIFDGMSLVYFGINHPSRLSDSTSSELSYQNRSKAILEAEKTPQDLINKPILEGGYEISKIDSSIDFNEDDKTVKDMYELYHPFAWKKKDIVEMLNSKTRMITVAKKKGTIVSAGVAEREAVQIQFGGVPYQLDLIELTDAATLVAHEGGENHEGKGLYSAVSTLALQEIAKAYADEGETPQGVLVFGESNSKQLGLLMACVRQGRSIAEGLLEKHVPILDPGEKRDEQKNKFNSFFPTYIGKSKLREKYGNN